MMAIQTVKILSFDGGGIRGYLSSTFFKRFCTQALIPHNKIYENFDIITGTSTGALQAIAYAFSKSPQDILTLFETKGQDIFHKDYIFDRKSYFYAVMACTNGYPLGDTTGKVCYRQEPLRDALTNVLGASTLLNDLPGKVIIPSYDTTNELPVMYSNITGMGSLLTTGNMTAVDVALASAAAPIYFPPNEVNGSKMIDGGVCCNNPSNVAYAVAKKLYPAASRFCILSIGTGIAFEAFIPSEDPPELTAFDHPSLDEFRKSINKTASKLMAKYPEHSEPLKMYRDHALGDVRISLPSSYNLQYLGYLMNSVFIPGPQMLENQKMRLYENDVYDDVFYYRFQYPFEKGQDSSMDNPDASNLAALASYAHLQYDKDQEVIDNFISHLNAVER